MSKRKQTFENLATPAKHQRLVNDSRDFGCFENLPEEIREMIFDYLPGKDLMRLASANKTFNDYIGTNTRYMKKVVVKNVDNNVDWYAYRNYENFRFSASITPAISARIIKWLENIKDGIKTVKFNSALSKPYFMLLSELVNLEEVFIESFAKSRPSTILYFPKLKYLEVLKANDILSVFENCNQLKGLKICRYTGGNDFLVQFVKKQTMLEEFHVGQGHSLFYYASINSITFKLSKISLTHQKDLTTYNGTIRNFENFINLHRDTLKELQVTSIEMLNYFKDFENIKSVEIVKVNPKYAIDMKACKVMEHVQKLTLKSFCENPTTYYKWLNTIETNFPNLEELSIQQGSPKNSSKLFGSLTKLKKLTLKEGSGFTEMQIPYVDTLMFINFDFTASKKPFEFAGNRIRNLTINGYGLDYQDPVWLKAFLKHTDAQLDLLEVIGVKLPNSFDKVLMENVHKVKKFIKR